MSTSIISIGGGSNATANANGLIPVASKFSAAINVNIQTYVDSALTAPIVASQTALINNDVATGVAYGYETNGDLSDTTSGSAGQSYNASVGGTGVYEITNTDSAGGVVAAAPIGNPYTVTGGSTSFVAQEGGSYTVKGAAATTFALLGAYSNVSYSVVDPAAGVIYAAGGANTININYDSSGAENAETVYSAGHDSINLTGLGNDFVSAEGSADDLVTILEGSSTVTADGNATVQVTFAEHAGGNLDFINNSTASQTVFSGAYTAAGGASVFAPNSVTAFGGAGGGYYVGGLAGNNSLVGGTGDAILQGGGTGDFLEVTGGDTGSGNVIFSGNGVETIIATAATNNNAIQLGGPYTGKGTVTTSGSASSDGSGYQSFVIGNVAGETITGSSVKGAYNFYDIIGDSTTGGSTFTITDFTAYNATTVAGSEIFLVDGSLGKAGDASVQTVTSSAVSPGSALIVLTDGTQITLKGVSASSVTVHAAQGTVAGSIII